ncbi:MAG: hypothetical protein QOD57_5474, partial [Actinomycetota bacterium]|nr:hypothetical protein [Actinomycetota bacterium]
LRPFTAAQADDFYELVCERRRSSLIFTSNRQPADWYGLSLTPLSQKGFSTAS